MSLYFCSRAFNLEMIWLFSPPPGLKAEILINNPLETSHDQCCNLYLRPSEGNKLDVSLLCSTGTGRCCSQQCLEGSAARGPSGMSKAAVLGRAVPELQAVGMTSSARRVVSELDSTSSQSFWVGRAEVHPCYVSTINSTAH